VSNSPPWGVYIVGWGGRLAPSPRQGAGHQGWETLLGPYPAHAQTLGAPKPLSNKGAARPGEKPIKMAAFIIY
jgi:hypothetical protein